MQTSRPIVTVGDDEKNSLALPASGLPETFEMFERVEGGYRVRFTDKLEGTLALGDEEWALDELVEQRRAERDGRVTTGDGAADVFEVTLVRGDWGIIRLGSVSLFFQLVEQRDKVAGRGVGGIFEPAVAAMILLAAIVHVGFLVAVMLTWDADADLEERHLPDGFVHFHVDDVEDPLEDEEEIDEPVEETSGAKAAGEEGKLGDEDEEVEDSKVPEIDGEMVEEVDVENVGVNKALADASIGEGALVNLFENQDGFDSKINVATSGEGDELDVGRGAGGMGLRGDGAGGGGESIGGIQTIGGVGSGTGRGGATLPEKEREKLEPTLDVGRVETGDFCDKQNIRQVIDTKARSIKYCYEKQLQQNPKLKGKVVAQWKVDLDGSVSDATIASSSIDDRQVESCITRVLQRLSFQAPDGGICVINYPFVFSGIE